MKGKVWTITLKVSQVWIDDGFEANESDIEDALSRMLPFADEGEIQVSVSDGKPCRMDG